MSNYKFKSREEIENYVKSLSINDIIVGYINLIEECQEQREKERLERAPKIKITQEQFEQYFSLVGEKGVGRKPKNPEETLMEKKKREAEYQRSYYLARRAKKNNNQD